MEIRNKIESKTLTAEELVYFSDIAAKRNFDAKRYVTAKAILLNHYMTINCRDTCVIAVSGGLDSAVVLAIVSRAQELPDSPIKRIVPLALPSTTAKGVTGQVEAKTDAELVCESLGHTAVVIDMDPIVSSIRNATETNLGIETTDWAAGQVVSYARTPTYYYVTSLLSSANYRPIVVGTTNRSECANIGYFGKASDGMVDVQLITDIYKHEVRAVARYLRVPESIISRVPKGDLHDGASDEEVFGAPYEALVLYDHATKSITRDKNPVLRYHYPVNSLATWFQNIEDLMSYNAHKYKTKSPAIHLDIMEETGANCPWIPNNPRELLPVDEAKLVNHNSSASIKFNDHNGAAEIISIPGLDTKNAFIIRPNKGRQSMVVSGLSQGVPANVNGKEIKKHTIDNVAHSYRQTIVSDSAALALWDIISPHLTPFRKYHEFKIRGLKGIWKPVGVSNVFRVIDYKHGGKLVNHVDSSFVHNDNLKTLMSVVISMDDECEGGETTFTKSDIMLDSLNDMDGLVTDESKILAKIKMQSQDIMVFDHHIRHQGEEVNGLKTIIRTDVIFERVDNRIPCVR